MSLQKHACLEDSFDMWLHIVYMHMWMLLTRFKQENRDGEVMLIKLVEIKMHDGIK